MHKFGVISCLSQMLMLFNFSVDIEGLGSILAQICVSLQPLLHHRPKQVAEIFNFLIVQNRQVVDLIADLQNMCAREEIAF